MDATVYCESGKMIDTKQVIFSRAVQLDVTAAELGKELGSGDRWDQATILVAWADEVIRCDCVLAGGDPTKVLHDWSGQCALIVGEMSSIERAYVLAIIDVLAEHLRR